MSDPKLPETVTAKGWTLHGDGEFLAGIPMSDDDRARALAAEFARRWNRHVALVAALRSVVAIDDGSGPGDADEGLANAGDVARAVLEGEPS